MKLTLLFCFLSLFLTFSCGSDNDDNDDTPSVTTPTNEDDRQNEDDNTNDDVVSKYTSVLLKADDVMFLNYSHSLRMDLGRRPVIVTGNFTDGPDEEVEGQTVTCSFQATLTEAQADRLERLANKLKFCSRDVEIEEEVDFSELSTIQVTDRTGKVTDAYNEFLGETHPDDQTWICGGRSSFYSYVRRVVRPKVPANCPAGAMSRF